MVGAAQRGTLGVEIKRTNAPRPRAAFIKLVPISGPNAASWSIPAKNVSRDATRPKPCPWPTCAVTCPTRPIPNLTHQAVIRFQHLRSLARDFCQRNALQTSPCLPS